MTYATLGDIAEELRKMRADGMTRSSVEYALEQVYWDQVEPKRARPAVDAQLIERGTGAALSTLTDHEAGAGSDLAPGDIDLDDDTYIEIHGRIDIRQLVREILEATR